ncbi:unnamed protein product [Bursaphelenchus xylophilus]|uniref:(pine wood nematode) hypothetical protein n=1 Tax=Bursaphelenchus xylophilus TaxID=6326 RepID=A0A1I7RM00_BURXY|nr:unnamed protein product [Bursaphelenchus xylophilus]CAG9113402.1 unnamed protein product [Bursaphelenchus xylophilus]
MADPQFRGVMNKRFTNFVLFVTIPITHQIFYYVRIPYQMTTYESSFSQKVGSLQDCIDRGAKNTSVILLKYNKKTGACVGYRYYIGVQYYANTDTVVNFVRSHRCLSRVSIEDAERLIVENLFANDICMQITFEDGSFSPGFSYNYDTTSGYCYQPYGIDSSNTSYTGPYKNWQVGIMIDKFNSKDYDSYVMTRGQMMMMAKHTCEPYMSDRLYYGGNIYCYNYTKSMKITNNVGNPCVNVLTGGYPLRLNNSMLYGKIYGYSGQSYRPFSGLVTYDGRTYVYSDNTTVPANVTLNWKKGYPNGKQIAVMNANLQLFDQNSITGVVHCMSDATKRSDDAVCAD